MQVAIGARVMLRRNVCTEDGLVNGAMGSVVGYEWPGGHRTAAEQPCGLRVLFDNARVGRLSRGAQQHLPTIVHPATSRFNGRNGKDQFERYQFPIILAWAVTIHKVQGLSLTRAVIDLGPDIFAHDQAYVALSRVRSMDGVMLVGLTRASFNKNKTEVHDEYDRLSRCPIT